VPRGGSGIEQGFSCRDAKPLTVVGNGFHNLAAVHKTVELAKLYGPYHRLQKLLEINLWRPRGATLCEISRAVPLREPGALFFDFVNQLFSVHTAPAFIIEPALFASQAQALSRLPEYYLGAAFILSASFASNLCLHEKKKAPIRRRPAVFLLKAIFTNCTKFFCEKMKRKVSFDRICIDIHIESAV